MTEIVTTRELQSGDLRVMFQGGRAQIRHGANVTHIHKDEIKAVAVFLLNEIGETVEAVKACARATPEPFPFDFTDNDGDTLTAEHWGRTDGPWSIAIINKEAGCSPSTVCLSPEAAAELGRRLIAWAESVGA